MNSRWPSAKEAPGANAIILYREVYGDDNNYSYSEYVRIKVLTEAGRRYADVELPFYDKGRRIVDISGRTIHPDGSVANFDGKVFSRSGHIMGKKVVVKAFTLPDVTVGSIVEYRYERRWDQNIVYNTWWYIQGELFTKHAKFFLRTYQRELNTRGGTHIFWNVFNLPPAVSPTNRSGLLSLEMNDIPAFEHEENSPPYEQLAMGVHVYYGGSDIKPMISGAVKVRNGRSRWTIS